MSSAEDSLPTVTERERGGGTGTLNRMESLFVARKSLSAIMGGGRLPPAPYLRRRLLAAPLVSLSFRSKLWAPAAVETPKVLVLLLGKISQITGGEGSSPPSVRSLGGVEPV